MAACSARPGFWRHPRKKPAGARAGRARGAGSPGAGYSGRAASHVHSPRESHDAGIDVLHRPDQAQGRQSRPASRLCASHAFRSRPLAPGPGWMRSAGGAGHVRLFPARGRRGLPGSTVGERLAPVAARKASAGSCKASLWESRAGVRGCAATAAGPHLAETGMGAGGGGRPCRRIAAPA